MNLKETKPLKHPLRNISNISKFNKKSQNLLSCSQRSSRQELKSQQLSCIMYCSNHPNTLSSHRIQEQEEILYYCQKCSILLENQGFNTSPLSNSYQSRMFIDKLSQSLHNIQSRKSLTLERQDKLAFQYEKMVKKISAYKQNILNKIENLFNSQLENINQNLAKEMKQLEIEKSSLLNYEKEIRNIIQDIQQNISSIDKIPSKLFSNTISQYSSVLNKHQKATKSNISLNILNQNSNNFNTVQDSIKKSIEQSLVINQGNNLLFSLSDTLKNNFSKKITLFDDNIKMVESLNPDLSLTQQSIVQYRINEPISRLF